MRKSCLLVLVVMALTSTGCFTAGVVDASMDEPVALLLLPVAMAADAAVIAASSEPSGSYEYGEDYESDEPQSETCSGPWSCGAYESRICVTENGECSCHCRSMR